MAVVSMKHFVEAGAHFGHQTSRWHPRMKPYIYGSASGVHIIDLRATLRELREAHRFVRDLAAEGGELLFVGTKPQARDIVAEEAKRCGGFYINARWLGGLATNFSTIKRSIAKLHRLEEMLDDEEVQANLLKKELLRLDKERYKLELALGGIREMRRLPDAMFIVDCQKEHIALAEANKLGIPVVAVVDTNCDPALVQHVIPGNDDAARSIHLFTHVIANAVLTGKRLRDERLRQQGSEERSRRRGGGRNERSRRGTGRGAGGARSGAAHSGREARRGPAREERPTAKPAARREGEASSPPEASAAPPQDDFPRRRRERYPDPQSASGARDSLCGEGNLLGHP